MTRWGWGGCVAALVVIAMGCVEPLHHGLVEEQANTMVVVLSQHGIEAEKVRDPGDEDLWALVVPAEQRVRAWGVLTQQGLPRPAAAGFEEFYPTSGLIPTAQEERVMLQVATARELQTSLLKVQGVVDAHVHLVLPERPRVRPGGAEQPRPRASVLVQWSADREHPPMEVEEIRRLISGGVDGLDPADVEVVLSQMEAQIPAAGEPVALSRVGPLMVEQGSQIPLKILILGMGAVIIALAAGLVYAILFGRREVGQEGGS
jgi:type III secretion protein J